MWTLKLLGTATVEGPDGVVAGRAAQRHRLALLALLALARGRPITRDRMVGLLWPESGPDRARPQLSDALYIVRGALGEHAIRSSGDDLSLNSEAITSDVATFERLLDEGRIEAAVESYTGPLLEGFHLSGTAEFERWLDGERARLDQRYAAALESLAGAAEAGEEPASAVGWWRRLAAHDPLSGRIALRLMRALEGSGDRAGALQHARVHATLLRHELETDVDPEVAAFAERLRTDPVARPGSSAPKRLQAAPAAKAAPVAEEQPDSAPASAARDGDRRRPRRIRASAAALAVLLLGFAVVYGIRSARVVASPGGTRSIAVLPFVNMSADPANSYFSDGLSEEIISALGHIDGLRVVARTSSFALRDRGLDIRAIGDTLGVAAVLEGSVRRDGERVRIAAQLIDAPTGYHIWADEYDRELRDIFAVQEEIAVAIAGALELRLAGGGRAETARPPIDLEAYDLYLRGLHLRNNLTGPALRQATVYFDRVIELEPGFALAYAAKASVVAPLVYFDHIPREEGVPEVRALVARALELDPGLGEGHAVLGLVRLFFEWDWDGAEQALRRSVELNPNDPHALHHLANYLHAMGRFAESAAARERGVQLDPLNARTRYTLGTVYGLVGDSVRAMTNFRRAVELDPVNAIGLGLGPDLPSGPVRLYLWQGRYDEAVEEYLRIAALRGASARELASIRQAYIDSGMRGFWRAWLEMDIRQSAGAPNPVRMAAIWALIGDTAQTFQWLDRGYAERSAGMIWLRSEPAFQELRSHPHFRRILRDMRFPGE